MEHLLRDVRDVTISTLADQVGAKLTALKVRKAGGLGGALKSDPG